MPRFAPSHRRPCCFARRRPCDAPCFAITISSQGFRDVPGGSSGDPDGPRADDRTTFRVSPSLFRRQLSAMSTDGSVGDHRLPVMPPECSICNPTLAAPRVDDRAKFRSSLRFSLLRVGDPADHPAADRAAFQVSPSIVDDLSQVRWRSHAPALDSAVDPFRVQSNCAPVAVMAVPLCSALLLLVAPLVPLSLNNPCCIARQRLLLCSLLNLLLQLLLLLHIFRCASECFAPRCASHCCCASRCHCYTTAPLTAALFSLHLSLRHLSLHRLSLLSSLPLSLLCLSYGSFAAEQLFTEACSESFFCTWKIKISYVFTKYKFLKVFLCTPYSEITF